MAFVRGTRRSIAAVDQSGIVQLLIKSEEAVQRLRHMVAGLEFGDRIPSERDLAVRWGVARMTARKAIETAAAEGWLERRRGRAPTSPRCPMPRRSGCPRSQPT